MTTAATNSQGAASCQTAASAPGASNTVGDERCVSASGGYGERAPTYRMTDAERIQITKMAARMMARQPWLSRNAVVTKLLLTEYVRRDAYGRAMRDLDGAVSLPPEGHRPSRAQLNYLLRSRAALRAANHHDPASQRSVAR